jgi:phage anti-repressor protein
MSLKDVMVFKTEIYNMKTIIMNRDDNKVVSGRDLWKLLGIKKDFTGYMYHALKLFTENVDYIKYKEVGKRGGRPLSQYNLTIDCAKHIALKSNSVIGKHVREYFIQAEKELNQDTRLSIFEDIADKSHYDFLIRDIEDKCVNSDKIYLISDGTNCKIGYTSNIEERLETLQVGNANTLTVLYEKHVDDAPAIENMLHKHFEDRNIRGEWFNFGDILVTLIDEIDRLTFQANIDNAYEKNINLYTMVTRIAFSEFLSDETKNLVSEIFDKNHFDKIKEMEVSVIIEIVKNKALEIIEIVKNDQLKKVNSIFQPSV